jgi:hypothetical protein
MEELKTIVTDLGTDLVDFAKKEGVKYVKNQAILIASNKMIDDYINPPLRRYVKVNVVWNFLLIMLILFNNLTFTPKLLKLYYIVSSASTFYTIHRITSKIECLIPLFTVIIPYTLAGIRSYLNMITMLIMIELTGIFFDWQYDILVYLAIFGITIHTLTPKNSIVIYQTIRKCMDINTDFRDYMQWYFWENVAVMMLYGFMR